MLQFLINLLRGNSISMLPSSENDGKYRKSCFCYSLLVARGKCRLQKHSEFNWIKESEDSQLLVNIFLKIFFVQCKYACHRLCPSKPDKCVVEDTDRLCIWTLQSCGIWSRRHFFSFGSRRHTCFRKHKKIDRERKENTFTYEQPANSDVQFSIYLFHPKNDSTILRLCSTGFLEFVGVLWNKKKLIL